MKGMKLARLYYETYGRQMIQTKFKKYENRIAVGLVGQGSECFGFDDEISRDHDFGPSFCMWLTDDDFKEVGIQLQKEYDNLPKKFMEFPQRIESIQSVGRVGALSTSGFYSSQIGKAGMELSLLEWLYIPESRLAAVTNGQIFYDPLGDFSKVRKKLLDFYPEDVRIKKIAARAVAMSQSGQYNYARCMCRGESVAAFHALNAFIENTVSIIFLLNKQYKPFYKWMHRAMKRLPILGNVSVLLNELSLTALPISAWTSENKTGILLSLNTRDNNILLIEQICRLVKGRLQKDDFISGDENFLAVYGDEITSHIKDDKLRLIHILEG